MRRRVLSISFLTVLMLSLVPPTGAALAWGSPCGTNAAITNVSYLITPLVGLPHTVSQLHGNTHQGDIVAVSFTIAAGCTETVSLVSYTAPGPNFDPATANQQAVYLLSASGSFGPGAHTLIPPVGIPLCYYQIDFVRGPVLTQLGGPGHIFYGSRLLDSDNGGTNPCGGGVE